MRKLGGSQFFPLRLALALLLALSRMAWAGNYFQGVAPASVPWPGGIVPYCFDTNYTVTATESNVIIAGLCEWELAANVKFVPYTNQANYVLLQYTNDGSGTGYYLSGPPAPATIMLHGLARGLMCHEGGHLFGLQHEHQRIDRGNYIVINTNNIIGGTNGEGGLSEFLIDSNSTAFGPYDLESIMHYGPDTFNIGPGFDSLDPLPAYEKYYYKIGNIALSIGDRATVSNLYGATLTPLSNVVTNTADGGFGSLRAAIYYANDHPGTTIQFDIPTSDPGYHNGTFTISLIGELPPLVSAGTVVDGTTQPGFVNYPVIALNGSQVPPEAGPVSGLNLYGTNCTVRALAFDNFSDAGIQLFCSDATSNLVENCYLGLKPDGTNAAPNFNAGIYFQHGAHDNVIGGLNATQRNIISGNSYYGVLINDTNSDRNVILGNYIGLNATGTAPVTNFYSGIGIWDGPNGTVIGGTNAGARNVLSGNQQYGIYLSDSNVSGTTILGNFIGTDFSGSNSVPNGNAITNSYAGIGIFSGANGNTIGGTNALARNIISGNTNVGIYLAGPGVTNNVVQGNYIGVNVSGTVALPSQGYGIYLIGGVSGNTIGGTSPGARNVISGNQSGNPSYGLYISDPGTSNNFVLGNYIGPDVTGTNAIGDGGIGIGILNSASGNFIGGISAGAGNLISGNGSYGIATYGANNNTIQGNYVGTDFSGKNALPYEFAGIALMFGSTGNLVGGTAAGAGNVISANGSYGVYIYFAGTTNNLVQGNIIGADVTGTNALGNGIADVTLLGGATGNFIGGTGAGAGNVIAFGGSDGVALYDSGTTNNSIRGNSIFSNGNLGIDLNGVANDLQNFPVITNAYGYAASTIILGNLNSAANSSFFIDVYRSVAAGEEGQFYLGTGSVTTDGSGNASFAYTNTGGNYAGQSMTATATDANGDTSEFSAGVLASNVPSPSAQFGTSFAWQTNGFIFNLTFQTNFSYHIQATTNLAANLIPWVNLTNFTATSSSLTFTDRTATSFRTRFYRVVSP
jgi:hypothetical protein